MAEAEPCLNMSLHIPLARLYVVQPLKGHSCPNWWCLQNLETVISPSRHQE
jgi:hypothetical protein